MAYLSLLKNILKTGYSTLKENVFPGIWQRTGNNFAKWKKNFFYK